MYMKWIRDACWQKNLMASIYLVDYLYHICTFFIYKHGLGNQNMTTVGFTLQICFVTYSMYLTHQGYGYFICEQNVYTHDLISRSILVFLLYHRYQALPLGCITILFAYLHIYIIVYVNYNNVLISDDMIQFDFELKRETQKKCNNFKKKKKKTEKQLKHIYWESTLGQLILSLMP